MTMLCLVQDLVEIVFCTRERHTSQVLGVKLDLYVHKILNCDVGMTSL